MGRKKIDTVVYKDTSFDLIAERVYVFLLQLNQEKKIKSLGMTFTATVRAPLEAPARGFRESVKGLFKKKPLPVQDHHNPYETVDLFFKNMKDLPYSYAALLEAIRDQTSAFGDCHALQISVYPSKKQHRTDMYNDFYIYTDVLGEEGKDKLRLRKLKYQGHTSLSRKVYLRLPLAYEKEFFKLEQNIFKPHLGK